MAEEAMETSIKTEEQEEKEAGSTEEIKEEKTEGETNSTTPTTPGMIPPKKKKPVDKTERPPLVQGKNQ